MSIGKAPPKWIYFGTAGGASPLAAIVSSEWEAWAQENRRERRRAKRQPVIDRDGMVCQLCGEDIEDEADLHIDHIIPVSKGGSPELSNLQAAHAKCNMQKGAR